MKKYFTLSFIIVCFGFTFKTHAQDILFIGNSYTNGISNTFVDVAKSLGENPAVTEYSPGGITMSQHAENQQVKDLIKSKKWDFVVIQEQSQMPLVYPNTTKDGIRALAELILANDSCTEIVVFMTWGRQEGDDWLVQSGLTAKQMEDRFIKFYSDVIKVEFLTPGRIAPIGAAFQKARINGINTYSGDKTHQNQDGRYLQACVFYSTFYEKSAVGASTTLVSTSDIGSKLQSISDSVVFDNKWTWNIDKIGLVTDKVSIIKGAEIVFTEAVFMHPFPKLTWTFEGGSPTTSNLESLKVRYNNVGLYDVTLQVQNGCGVNSSINKTDYITVKETTSINDIDKGIMQLYPNPSTDAILLKVADGSSTINTVRILSLDGKVIAIYDNLNKHEMQIPVYGMTNGTYVVNIILQTGKVIHQTISIQN